MAKEDCKREALRLRCEERMSLSKIAKTLGVAKATVSVWVRDFPLTPEEIEAFKRQTVEPQFTVSCFQCGNEFRTYKASAKYCSRRCSGKADGNRNARTVKNTKTYRQRNKQKAVEYKGGKCVVCGYSRCVRALKFHHINPEEKDFEISHPGRRWEVVQPELDKCILVCGNCHDEIHEGLIDVNKFIHL